MWCSRAPAVGNPASPSGPGTRSSWGRGMSPFLILLVAALSVAYLTLSIPGKLDEHSQCAEVPMCPGPTLGTSSQHSPPTHHHQPIHPAEGDTQLLSAGAGDDANV